MQSIVLGVRAKVMEGHTLADGFADFPRVFPEIYRSTVSAGEQAGHLDYGARAAGGLHREPRGDAPEGLGRHALPHRISVMCVMIVAGLMVYVVPKVVNVFTASHAQLPMMTRALIARQ